MPRNGRPLGGYYAGIFALDRFAGRDGNGDPVVIGDAEWDAHLPAPWRPPLRRGPEVLDGDADQGQAVLRVSERPAQYNVIVTADIIEHHVFGLVLPIAVSTALRYQPRSSSKPRPVQSAAAGF